MWQVNILRLTAFLTKDAQIPFPNGDHKSWWSQLVGESPATRNIQPRKGQFEEGGPFGNGQLISSVSPMRIDWKYVPVFGEETGDLLPVLGPFSELLSGFHDLMNRWFSLEDCPPAQRLAFGAILFEFVENRVEGYKTLSKFLESVNLNPENSRDFLYQINRPRNSTTGISGLSINRLSKWAVAIGQMRGLSPDQKFMSFESQPSCMLELDINTDSDFNGKFSREQSTNVFGELVELGKEISQKGDIP